MTPSSIVIGFLRFVFERCQKMRAIVKKSMEKTLNFSASCNENDDEMATWAVIGFTESYLDKHQELFARLGPLRKNLGENRYRLEQESKFQSSARNRSGNI